MKHFTILFLLVASIFTNVFAVSGTAVSRFTRKSPTSGTPKEGTITRFDIADNKVVNKKDIYTDGETVWPTLNMAGTKVAFWRKSAGKYYISVINIDGSGLTDVLSTGFSAPADLSVDNINVGWIDQDWIYYTHLEKTVKDGKGSYTNEIWKVKLGDASTNQFVYKLDSYGFLRASINAPADRIVTYLRDHVSESRTIKMYSFPNSQPPADKDFTTLDDQGYYGSNNPRGDCDRGCNAFGTISGNQFVHFHDGKHEVLYIHNWEPGKCIDLTEITEVQIAKWGDHNKFETGTSNRIPRFSCNSEKWVCSSLGWDQAKGGNQIMVNWVDGEAFFTTNNTPERDCPDENQCPNRDNYDINSSGDFHVAGIPSMCYETTEGTLEKWDGTACPEDRTGATVPVHRFSFEPKGGDFQVFTITGAHVKTVPTRAAAQSLISSLPKGTYVIRNGKMGVLKAQAGPDRIQ